MKKEGIAEDIAEDLCVNIHMYADDTQLYVHCSPRDAIGTASKLELCLESVDKWTDASRLKLNSEKSEVISGRRHDSKSEGCITWFASGASGKKFLYPHFSKCGGYKQANISFKKFCCLVVALINMSWAYSIANQQTRQFHVLAMTTQTRRLHCVEWTQCSIHPNGAESVRYMQQFPWAHPSPKRKRYLDCFRIFCRAH